MSLFADCIAKLAVPAVRTHLSGHRSLPWDGQTKKDLVSRSFPVILPYCHWIIEVDTLVFSLWLNIPSELAAVALTIISSAASRTHAKLPSTFLIFILLRLLDSIHKLHLPRCLVSVRYLIIQTFPKKASPILLHCLTFSLTENAYIFFVKRGIKARPSFFK